MQIPTFRVQAWLLVGIAGALHGPARAGDASICAAQLAQCSHEPTEH